MLKVLSIMTLAIIEVDTVRACCIIDFVGIKWIDGCWEKTISLENYNSVFRATGNLSTVSAG